MAETLMERIVNRNGVAWIRTHATNCELNALCSSTIHADTEEIELSTGEITCPDCIEIVKRCQSIRAFELAPEYENEFLARKLDR